MKKHTGAAILLWPVVRWQAEPLESLEIDGGEESCLQPKGDSTLEQETAPEEVHNSGGSSH